MKAFNFSDFNQNIIQFDSETDYYAIGDVHGCIDEYAMLCSMLRAESERNERKSAIIQLGDMIDRGPSFIPLIIQDDAEYKVMGNHELNFINELYGYTECRSNARKKNLELFEAASKEIQDIVLSSLLNRKFYFEMDDEQGVRHVFSHAPLKYVERGLVSTNDLMHHYSGSSFCMRSNPVNIEEMVASVKTPHRFYHGHQSWEYTDIFLQMASQWGNDVRIFNLDSSCVYGESLTAMKIGSEEKYTVKAKKIYFAK